MSRGAEASAFGQGDGAAIALGLAGALLAPPFPGDSGPMAATGLLAELFFGLPHIMFWVKDGDGRYVAVNQAFVDRARRPTPADVVGRSARDLFPSAVASACEAQDRMVMASARPLRNELEVVLRPDGSPGWYLSNKIPVLDGRASVAATVGVSVDLQKPAGTDDVLARLAEVVAVVRARYREPLRVDELAAVGRMTPLQLERRMRRFLGVSPKQYVMRTRVEHAGRLLATSEMPIAEVADLCGYYDQSALTTHFKRVTGLTPGEWVTRFASTRKREG